MSLFVEEEDFKRDDEKMFMKRDLIEALILGWLSVCVDRSLI